MTEHQFNNYAELAEEGERYKAALLTWFDDHGEKSRKPFPADIIAIKRRRLAWCEKVIELCERAQARAAQ